MRMPLECTIDQQSAVTPYADVVVEPDASRPVYSYLAERASEFPGVDIQNAWLREYPFKTVGAHLFGTVGQIDENGLRDANFRGVRGGSIVGKQGLEYTYDKYLRGTNGAQRIEVDAQGRPKRKLREVTAVKGSDVQLSLDARLQRVGQQALSTGIGLAQANGNPADGGAFVALDPRNGEVLAMGSNPTFDPNDFTRPIPDRVFRAKYGEEANDPLFNRAMQGGFAIGSTFKIVTAAAGLDAGITTPGTFYNDTGVWTSADGGQRRRNAGGAVFGSVDLEKALAVSVDTYFYDLGARLNLDAAERRCAAEMGARLRLRRAERDRPRRRDVRHRAGPGLAQGSLEARAAVPQAEKSRQLLHRRRPSLVLGDNVSLAIGQGDFLASPLQLAVAYAAIENGGTIVRPHIGMSVLDEDDRIQQRIAPKPVRAIDIPDIDTIRRGLLDSTTQAGGTSVDVFQGFGRPVYGKTGTAQITNRPDQSWYVAYVPDPERPIVVAAVIENGGFGAQAAAPAVRQILSQWFYGRAGEAVAGRSASY